ncbi:MAG: hypothetical protein ACLQPD_14830 [Desulfomonilaceae bacterium]
MIQPWIIGTFFAALIVASIIYELITGVARVRGMGKYQRDERPGSFWTVIILKGLLAAAVVAVAFTATVRG